MPAARSKLLLLHSISSITFYCTLREVVDETYIAKDTNRRKECWPRREITNKAKSMDWNTSDHSILFAHSSSHVIFNPPTHVFALPVAQSWLRPSSHHRFARRPVFASPVAPSSLRPSPRLRFAPSSLRPSPRLRFARRPVFASPVAPSSLRPSSRLRLLVTTSSLHRIVFV
ncbi:Uncharacterized protein APZ42_028840, partial [Daphnia magna]